MAKVCVGCGFDTDDDGNLVVDGVVAWADSGFTCNASEAGDIYCDATEGLKVAPEKFHFFRRGLLELVGAADEVQLTSLGGVTAGGPVVTFGGNLVGETTNSVVVLNPSPCRPLIVKVDCGVEHAAFNKYGNGNSNFQAGARLIASGNLTPSDDQMIGHQGWGHNGAVTKISWDTQGSQSTRTFIIAAGGTGTFVLRAQLRLFSDNGNTTVTGWSNFVNLDCWNS